jgi:hypothetical protein
MRKTETFHGKNQLRQIKQLTDCQAFIVLDSGENVPTGYQQISVFIGLDFKYDVDIKHNWFPEAIGQIMKRRPSTQELYKWIP